MNRRWLACAVVVGLVSAIPKAALAESKFSDWGPPVSLGCGAINSNSNDAGPGLSKDGLSLYFGSNRRAAGDTDIYVAQRPSQDAPWGAPTPVTTVNSHPYADNVPSLSRDGRWMFFNSNRPGGFGDIDVWASYRDRVHDDFAWQAPINLGPGINTAGFEAGASYFENDGGVPQLFFGRGVSAATQFATTDIWVADLQADGTFGNARSVDELNSSVGDQRPSIRFDGLEIFFYSGRPGGAGEEDIWSATRNSVEDSWNPPVDLAAVNTGLGEFQPHISADGGALYFGSTSADGACGGFNLFMTTRTRLHGGA